MDKLICKNCNQKTPRNMHNKCIYCGVIYPKEYWFSNDEKANKIDTMRKENEEAKRQREENSKKGKNRNDDYNQDGWGPSGGDFF